MKPSTFSFLTALALASRAWCIRMFDDTSQVPGNLTHGCKQALAEDIACSPYLITAEHVTSKMETNAALFESYCDKGCGNSLENWVENVHSCCDSETLDFFYSAELVGQPLMLRPAAELADSLSWARSVACLRSNATDGGFCALEFSGEAGIQECSDCTLKYLAAMKSSYYGSGSAPSDQGWAALLDKCCVNETMYPVLNWTAPEFPDPPAAHAIPCIGDCFHTVKENDTCESIAKEYGVAYDRLVYQNGLEWQCRNLPVGGDVCVGSPCAVYTIQANDTCGSIAAGQNCTVTELLAWNPSVHRSCDNLAWLEGRTVCVTPPGTDSYSINVTAEWWGREWAPPDWGTWEPVETVGVDWAPPKKAGQLAKRRVTRVVYDSALGWVWGDGMEP